MKWLIAVLIFSALGSIFSRIAGIAQDAELSLVWQCLIGFGPGTIGAFAFLWFKRGY